MYKYTALKRGYTLVELLIIIAIISLLVTFGLSAYARAQERQNVQQTKETLLALLQESQKNAYVGDKDCDGALYGIQVTMQDNTVRKQALCGGGNGTLIVTNLANVQFTSPSTVTFRPLDQGISLASGTQLNVDYTIGTSTYRITIATPGTITYVGEL